MYKEVCDFAANNDFVKSSDNTVRLIKLAAYICLKSNGTYEYIESVDSKPAKSVEAPTFGTYARTAKYADFICEKFGNIFGDESIPKHVDYMSVIAEAGETSGALKAVDTFLKNWENDPALRAKVADDAKDGKIKPDKAVSFKVDGIAVESMRSDWMDYFKSRLKLLSSGKEESDVIVSSISGKLQKSVPAKAGPVIQNVPNDIKAAFGIGRPVYIASAKYPSYESYGFDGALGFQMGEEDAKLFAAGMEYLLSNESHRNKDFKLVYFYSQDVGDVIGESLAERSTYDDEDDDETEAEKIVRKSSVISDILRAVKQGESYSANVDESVSYYMAQFDVYSGRQYISNEMRGSYKSLVDNLQAWYNDTKISSIVSRNGKCFSEMYFIKGFYDVFTSCISKSRLDDFSDKRKVAELEFKPYKMALLSAIYNNTQIPQIFYLRSIMRAEKAMSSGKRLLPVWCALIKCYLLRKGVDLMSGANTAYACGQLFAVYEQLQYKAQGSLNRNLSSNYFAAAMQQPSAIFTQISELGIVYLNKLSSKNEFVDLIGSLSKTIGTEFPKAFSDEEKGSFVLGYYTQRTDFMTANK